jgi:hypothetical protein
MGMKTYDFRPFNYRLPLNAEEIAARETMPKTSDGFIVSLFYLPPGQRAALEPQWQDWVRGQPKHLLPNWWADWLEFKRSGKTPSYVGVMRR